MSILTAENDIKERLSIAYATSVAARAGCELIEVHVDRNGIDATIRAIKGTPVKIDIQLKATATPSPEGDTVAFDLEVPTYNALRSTIIQAPQLLVVLTLPDDPEQWLRGDETSLAFKRCAYWMNLHGAPEVETRHTTRVHLPRTQRFHPAALQELMARTHRNAELGRTGIDE